MQDQLALQNNTAFLFFSNSLDHLTLDCFRGTESSSMCRLSKASVMWAILFSNSVDAWVRIGFANILSTEKQKDHIIYRGILVGLKTYLIFPLIPNSLTKLQPPPTNLVLPQSSDHHSYSQTSVSGYIFIISPLLQKKETPKQYENAQRPFGNITSFRTAFTKCFHL